MSIELFNGRIVITEKKNGKEVKKGYEDIFSAIRAHIYAIFQTLKKEEFDPFLLQNLIQRTSFLIALKRNDVKELEKAITELRNILNQEINDKVKLSIINKNIARIRNIKVIPIKVIAEKYIPLFNRPENKEKIQENIKKFIEELEKERDSIQEHEKKLRSIKNKESKEKEILPLNKNKFIVKVHNIFGEDLFLTVNFEQGELKITSVFLREEILQDYRRLVPREEDINDLKLSLSKLKAVELEEEVNLGRS